jgi:ABC-type xylose transport system permease subunit
MARAFGLSVLVGFFAGVSVALKIVLYGERLNRDAWIFIAAFAACGSVVGFAAGLMVAYASTHPSSRVAAITRSDWFRGDDD